MDTHSMGGLDINSQGGLTEHHTDIISNTINVSEGGGQTTAGLNLQVNRYQNKAPQTLTGRNANSSGSSNAVRGSRYQGN